MATERSTFTPREVTSQRKGVQVRQQGYADGKAGREQRWPGDAAYRASWRNGDKARHQQGGEA